METLSLPFGESEVLMRHPAMSLEDLATYVEAPFRAESWSEITEGVRMRLPMWRGVATARFPEERITSWASSPVIAEQFCGSIYVSGEEFVKHREEANVLAIILHKDEEPYWFEYLILEED